MDFLWLTVLSVPSMQKKDIKALAAMKILDYLDDKTVLTDLEAIDKHSVIDELSRPVAEKTGIPHNEITRVLMERERLGSTGIGGGIGIPHGKLSALKTLVIGFGLSRKGVDFDAMDLKPVHLFFLLLSPDDSTGLHLMLLARISRMLKDRNFRESLANAADSEDVLRILGEADAVDGA